METLIPLIIQLFAGGLGGTIVGKLVRDISMGAKGNAVAGACGGIVGTFIAGTLPWLDRLVGSVEGVGRLDTGALLGQGITGLVSGGIVMVVVGLVRDNMMKN